MPEGPEIWILSEAINKFYHIEKTKAYGKHLFVSPDNFGSTFSKSGCGENWSFGLTGTVQIVDDDNELIKRNTCWIYGDQVPFDNFDEETQKLGTNWLTSSAADLHKIVDSWIKSKKKLAGLILDQTKISGIGVAWGSEILFKADLRPDVRACDSFLNKLVDSMINIRKKIQDTYSLELNRTLEVCKISNNDTKLRELINCWFENLYERREMNIYKKVSKLQVLGRSWWVI